jgi:hypothetical protein
MAQKSEGEKKTPNQKRSSSWDGFVMPPGGTTAEIKESAKKLRERAKKEAAMFRRLGGLF